MSDKTKALPPVAVQINLWNYCKLIFMVVLSDLLWMVLILTGVNVFVYYIYSLVTKGVFDSETLKYAVMVAIGSYFCLILDKDKISNALNVKRDLPFITKDQIKKRK